MPQDAVKESGDSTATRRVFTPTIQLGAILQAVTVCAGLGFTVFQAGQWVAQIRADLRAETDIRLAHDTDIARDLTGLLSAEIEARKADAVDLRTGQAAIHATVTKLDQTGAAEIEARKADVTDLRGGQLALLATLARVDRSFQHLFAVTQPQPTRQRGRPAQQE